MILKKTSCFSKWYHKLTGNIQMVISTYVNRVADGNMSNCDTVGKGVHEIKIDYQKGYRVYFTNINGQIILLLLGGYKKRQQQDIQKAIQIKKFLETQK